VSMETGKTWSLPVPPSPTNVVCMKAVHRGIGFVVASHYGVDLLDITHGFVTQSLFSGMVWFLYM